MNHLAWLVRAKRWAQNPPSPGRVRLIFAVIGFCLLIAGYEWVFGWPEWLAVNRMSAKP